MIDILTSLFYFLIALSILVTIHEYGHYKVARIFGIKVLRFSIGFGKSLYSRKMRNGTEFSISMIPLGGYVKMLDEREGEVSEEEKPFAFNRRPVFQRIAVVCAGPMANFLFAIFAFWLVYMIGVKSYAAFVGNIVPNSLASLADIQQGQEILSVDEQATPTMESAYLALMSRTGDSGELTLTMQNNTLEQQKKVVLNLSHSSLEYKSIFDVLGFDLDLPSIKAKAWEVLPGHPGAKAGLRSGDEIISVNGIVINDWLQFVSYIRERPNSNINVEFIRDNIVHKTILHTESHKTESGDVGFIGMQVDQRWYDQFVKIERYSPIEALSKSIQHTWDLSVLTVKMLYKMVSGKATWENISGPISIAQGAAHSAKSGIETYLAFLALISVSLGVMNLLPIPLLDGGHLLFYLVEFITRRPIPAQLQNIGFAIGIMILLGLTGIALYNDFTRF